MLQTEPSNSPWYKDWFDSPHYHVLYQHRDDVEAMSFLTKLLEYLSPPKNASVLDLACGKGRHSAYLSDLGYNVTGVDLSNKSITHAKQFESETLRFIRSDMRDLQFDSEFHLVLNLFTSFGYFENKEDDLDVLRRVKSALLPEGVFVLDYLNSKNVEFVENRVEEKEIGTTKFFTKKSRANGFIIKDINLIDGDQNATYQEKVRLICTEQFEEYFHLTGLKILDRFGSYDLEGYSEKESSRLIYVLGKEVG